MMQLYAGLFWGNFVISHLWLLVQDGQHILDLDASSLNGVIWGSPPGNRNVSQATVASFTNGFICRPPATCGPPTQDIYNVDVKAAYNLPIKISPTDLGPTPNGSPCYADPCIPLNSTNPEHPTLASCADAACRISNLTAFCKPPNMLAGPDNACLNTEGAKKEMSTPAGSVPFMQACPAASSYADLGLMGVGHFCPTGTSYSIVFCY
ncbi:hypothetical protein WJX72_003770 [[Myrmecia] bisecta]|uniref:Thaumatin-like protein n=1 Tax=[Myrmecia] bisecta TaxID=41462 RepID=A0AAW1PAM1_9CHLO